jgi:flavin reductase (DIM6/NTAB) family NADH-FMN oxidoreductase RutF
VREQRYTYEALTARRAFTISLPDRAHAAAADYFGMVSGRDADKFARTGLTAARSRLVDAPYVAEFPLIVECVLRGTMDLGAHTLFVGEIVDVRVEEALLGADGHPDLEKMEPIAFMPGNDYYGFSGRVAAAFSAGAMYCGENQEG